MNCKSCKFWFSVDQHGNDMTEEVHEDFRMAECRANPPIFHTPLNQKRLDNRTGMSWMLGFWPNVNEDEWCGRYTQRNGGGG